MKAYVYLTQSLAPPYFPSCQYRASNFTLLISQFLRIPALFSFRNVDVDWMDPVVVFWRNIKVLLGKLPPFRAPADIDFLPDEPMVVDDLVFKHLRGRLMDTLRALPSTDRHESEDDDELATGFAEDFARLCLDIQLRLSARQIMYTSPASPDWIQLLHDDEEKSEARALIASSLALEEHRVNAIWEECYSSLTSTYERKEGPSFQREQIFILVYEQVMKLPHPLVQLSSSHPTCRRILLTFLMLQAVRSPSWNELGRMSCLPTTPLYEYIAICMSVCHKK